MVDALLERRERWGISYLEGPAEIAGDAIRIAKSPADDGTLSCFATTNRRTARYRNLLTRLMCDLSRSRQGFSTVKLRSHPIYVIRPD